MSSSAHSVGHFQRLRFSGVAMAAALAMAAVLAAAGCKKGEHDTPAEPPDLQIVSAGNEPRQILRYRIPKGTSQGIEVSADMTLTAGEMGGPLPTILMSMLIAVEDVGSDRRMKLHTTIVDATARDREDTKIPAAALNGPLEAMKGIAIEATLSPDGRLSKATVEGGKQLPEDVAKQLASLTSSLENVMMPLPNEPVGIGAVWRSSRPIEQNGMKLTAVSTFTLTGIDGDKLTFTLDTTVHGDDQTIKQGDLSITMKDITGTGGGHGTLTLTKLDMTNELTAEFRSQMASPGEEKPTPMTMTSVTRIQPSGATQAPASPPTGSAAGSAATGSGASAGSAAGGAATGSGAPAGSAAGSAATGSGSAAAGSGSAAAEEPAGSGSGSGRVDE